MARIIVAQFITVDGVVEDPDGSGETAFGGWAFRHGREAVAGDSLVTVRFCKLASSCSDGTVGALLDAVAGSR